MGENRRFDNSIGVSSSTMEKSLPDGRKQQEMADIVCHAKLVRLSVPLVPSSCLDVLSDIGKLRQGGMELQKNVFYSVKRHMHEQDILLCVDLSHPSFDAFLRPSGICAALDRICQQEEPSLFSEYSVNLNELSDSSAASPCES